MSDSVFDKVLIQREFRRTLGLDMEFNPDYLVLKKQIPRFMNYLGKNLRTIKDEIKRYSFGSTMKGVVIAKRGEMEAKYHGKFENFLSDYEATWKKHDSFSVGLGPFLTEATNGKISEQDIAQEGYNLLSQAVDNDIQLHLHTFLLQSVLKEKIGELGTTVVFPFEFFVNEEAILLSGEEFAAKYTYGDVPLAEKLMKTVKAKSLSELAEISEVGYRHYRLFPKGEDFLQENRLAHWEAFEEPRRRFSVLYGVFDYFLREMLFQKMQKRGIIPNDVSCALDIPVEEFLKYSEKYAKNGNS